MRFRYSVIGRFAALGLPGVLMACMPGQPDRGLEHELRAARAEAALEQQRVHELEARLARLEQRAAQEPVGQSPGNSGGSDAMIQRQLDVLITLNQELLREAQASRQPAALPTTNIAAPQAAPQPMVMPAADEGLTTEQKILELVLELKGERSPWRADGLSYEESQALRVLLRRERPLDRDNPWQ